jgi:hypothetical protein
MTPIPPPPGFSMMRWFEYGLADHFSRIVHLLKMHVYETSVVECLSGWLV